MGGPWGRGPAAALAGAMAPFDPLANDDGAMLQRPGAAHWVGTDLFGRDVPSRLTYGALTALPVGFGSSLLGGTLGAVVGVVSAYFGRKADLLSQRPMEIVVSFPIVILALVVVAILGTGTLDLVLAFAVPMVPRVAPVVRACALSIRAAPYVDAARALGFGHARITLRHMLPHVMAPYLINHDHADGLPRPGHPAGGLPELPGAGGGGADAGLGPDAPGRGVAFAETAPWMAVFPGLAISAAVFAFNLFGDSLRAALDPKLRSL